MSYFLCVVVLNILGNTLVLAAKSKSVNLNLETVLEFDNKNLESDVKIIDNVQKFLSKVRNVLDKSKDYRRSNSKDNMQFTDFLENVASHLLTYDDQELEELAAIVDEELRKYHYRGCKFYELVQNFAFRKFVTDLLEKMRNTRGKKMRKILERSLKKLKNKEFNERDMDFVNYINSLYRANAKDKMDSVLRSFESISKPSRRTHTNLVETVRKGIRSVVFDHYSDLNSNARKDLRMKIAKYFIEYIPGSDKKGEKAKTILSGAITDVFTERATDRMKHKERDGASESQEKTSKVKTTLPVLLPSRDLQEEKNSMPVRFISLYTEEIPTTTAKARTKKTKKKSRHHQHTTKMPLLRMPNFWEVPKPKPKPKPKPMADKFLEGLVIKRPKTVMVVREDRPLREILTEHNAVIQVMSSHSDAPDKKVDIVKRAHHKRKHSRTDKSKHEKQSLRKKKIPIVIETTTHATTRHKISKKRRQKQRKSFSNGLYIESFENNVLDGHYKFRKRNLNDSFTGKRSALRKREKQERARKGYRKTLLDALGIKNKGQAKKKVRYDIIDARRQREKVKDDIYLNLTHSVNGKITSKDTKDSPKFRAQSSEEEATTTIKYISDNYIVDKIHNLEKKLEVVLDKIVATTLKPTKAGSEATTSLVPPIVIVNRAKIYENIETTPNYPRIPFWKGTAKTTRIYSDESSSSSEEVLVDNDTLTTISITLHSNATNLVNITTPAKSSTTAKTIGGISTIAHNDAHATDKHGTTNDTVFRSHDVTLAEEKGKKLPKAARSFSSNNNLLIRQENGTVSGAKVVKSAGIEEKTTTKTTNKVFTKKDGRKQNIVYVDDISTKKYSSENDKYKISVKDSIEDEKKHIKFNKNERDHLDEHTISTNKYTKSNKVSADHSNEDIKTTKINKSSKTAALVKTDKDELSKKEYIKFNELTNDDSKKKSVKLITISKDIADELISTTDSTKNKTMYFRNDNAKLFASDEKPKSTKKENVLEDKVSTKVKSKDNLTTKILSEISHDATKNITSADSNLKIKENLNKNVTLNDAVTKNANTSFTTASSVITERPTAINVKFTISHVYMNNSSDAVAKNNSRRSNPNYLNPSVDSLESEDELKKKMDVTLYNWA